MHYELREWKQGSAIRSGEHRRIGRLGSAARGDAGCELFAVPNWLLRREDEIGCTVFAPVDAFDRPATGTPKEA